MRITGCASVSGLIAGERRACSSVNRLSNTSCSRICRKPLGQYFDRKLRLPVQKRCQGWWVARVSGVSLKKMQEVPLVLGNVLASLRHGDLCKAPPYFYCRLVPVANPAVWTCLGPLRGNGGVPEQLLSSMRADGLRLHQQRRLSNIQIDSSAHQHSCKISVLVCVKEKSKFFHSTQSDPFRKLRRRYLEP